MRGGGRRGRVFRRTWGARDEGILSRDMLKLREVGIGHMDDERDSSSCRGQMGYCDTCSVDGSCMQVNKSITKRCWRQVR